MEKRNFFLIFFSFLVVSLLIFIFGTAGFLKPVGDTFYKIAEPVRSVLRISKAQEDSSLLSKLGKVSDYSKLEAEVKALRDQFDSGNLPANALLPARVIGSPTFIPGLTSPQVLIIDKGEEDGVIKGMAAVVENNLVGVVSEVGEGQSKLILVTNESFSTTAKVGQALGVIKGVGSSEMLFGNVSLSYSMGKNDIVYSKGSVTEEGSGILPDLVIGRVVSVDKKASDIFQKAKVKSAVGFENLNYVFLILR